MNKVYICCPGDSVTGGPELLHQLSDALVSNGVEAYMLYYPFDKCFQTPDQYKKYKVKVADKEDCVDEIVILPEERTAFVDLFPRCKIYIWWLSVDSYFGKSSKHNGKSYFKYIKRLLKGRSKLLSKLKHCRHLVQSEYANLFLKKHGIESEFLSDYLNEAHFSDVKYDLEGRKNQILYNPKKGYQVTRSLMKKFPDYLFVPLQGMSSEEVASTLRESKIYIDFGSHPGKDRFPREAAMAGCCIITGKRGSAKNNKDVPIPEKYKLNEKSLLFANKFKCVVDDIFSQYQLAFNDFTAYREKISKERDLFDLSVKTIFYTK